MIRIIYLLNVYLHFSGMFLLLFLIFLLLLRKISIT